MTVYFLEPAFIVIPFFPTGAFSTTHLFLQAVTEGGRGRHLPPFFTACACVCVSYGSPSTRPYVRYSSVNIKLAPELTKDKSAWLVLVY